MVFLLIINLVPAAGAAQRVHGALEALPQRSLVAHFLACQEVHLVEGDTGGHQHKQQHQEEEEQHHPLQQQQQQQLIIDVMAPRCELAAIDKCNAQPQLQAPKNSDRCSTMRCHLQSGREVKMPRGLLSPSLCFSSRHSAAVLRFA